MGASQSSTVRPDLNNLEEYLNSQYKIESRLIPGSGRLMRTYRIRIENVTAVCKATFVDLDIDLEEQTKELERLKTLQGHVTPFVHWFIGPVTRGRRPVGLLRPHLYTTLCDRLASRPFLAPVEKWCITAQILQALQYIHEKEVVHGFVTAENIGLTSTGWVVLMDFASYKKAYLPDDDPSEYLYYFQPETSSTDTAHKRCYLAPERFVKAVPTDQSLRPSMDIFSTGCVLVELFLNGERCLDLGDLMDYRRAGKMTPALQQKLNKLESGALRTACRHMLHLDPTERLLASDYLERLSAQFPESLDRLLSLLERVTGTILPDARLALAAAQYRDVLWATMGKRDAEGEAHVEKALGHTALSVSLSQSEDIIEDLPVQELREADHFIASDHLEGLFNETDALLRQLNGLSVDDISDSEDLYKAPLIRSEENKEEESDRSPLCQSSLLIYLHIILSTIQHVQRPASKLVALRLVDRLALSSSNEARLQRIVPVLISLLQDQDPLVRASAVQVLTSTVSKIENFSPSDSKVFPQYIFKRVAPLVSDPFLVVRLAFARSVAVLAETALRFLDISHAVRLYEAVGSDTGGATPVENAQSEMSDVVFDDDVAKLLDSGPSRRADQVDGPLELPESGGDHSVAAGKKLINSTYTDELSSLHDTISRWVVHITTDQAEDSAVPKRALLSSDIGRLCAFFGLDGVMSFILPQILAFLNDRKNWELRAALFDALPSVCYMIGRAATEEFVLPCVEIGLVDVEDQVIGYALSCLARLIEMNLLSRSLLVGDMMPHASLLYKYGALLVYPSAVVRLGAIRTFATACSVVGNTDYHVYLLPTLRPFLRFQPSYGRVVRGLQSCVACSWTREQFDKELNRCTTDYQVKSTDRDTAWTSVGIEVAAEAPHGSERRHSSDVGTDSGDRFDDLLSEAQLARMRLYLRMLARHTVRSSSNLRSHNSKRSLLAGGIEGSHKLAQSIMFPRQGGSATRDTLPEWYSALRDASHEQDLCTSESTAIRSVSTLGHVYGLSIMGPAEGTTENIVGAADDSPGTDDGVRNVLRSKDSKILEASSAGQWGAESLVDPAIADTSLLVTKLKALEVPPLPPDLGTQTSTGAMHHVGGPTRTTGATDWKPRVNALVASSSPTSEHTAPVVRLAVSLDNSFFVSGSHDGTCRVWNIPRIDDSVGMLESSLVYSGHSLKRATRINDVAMVEGTHSIVSGDSSGAAHVWRVDVISSIPKSSTTTHDSERGRSEAVGASVVRVIEKNEGEILAVSHFNTLSASIIMFGTQKGYVHSWDLRDAREPFVFSQSPDFGYLTSVVLGGDRNWIVTGTSRGYVALWDIRFQRAVSVWHHSRRAPISRVATSMISGSHFWGTKTGRDEARPCIFVASGSNECAMFDALDGSCREAFRVVESDKQELSAHTEELPSLENVTWRRGPYYTLCPIVRASAVDRNISSQSINSMVGSIGINGQSYLITGGTDCRIRFWDFESPSKCYVVSGLAQSNPRPSFERIDVDHNRSIMLCRHPRSQGLFETSKIPAKQFSGLRKPELYHSDSIQDLKIVENCALLSCSRDSTVKVWH